MDSHRIASPLLDVSVNAQGAELTSLRHAGIGEVLWQAGPAWPQHAPNLFPIVGQLVGDQLHVDGRSYELKRHGFARRLRFDWIEASDFACRLVLRDDARTRAVFPFAFALEIGYVVRGNTLEITYVVRNTGTSTLPASVGAHPAFRWPLVTGTQKTEYTLTFERAELAPVRRLDDGLVARDRIPTPVDGRVLRLDDELFAHDAIVMDQLLSRSLRYGSGAAAPALDVHWNGFRHLGIWSKAAAEFVCIEPWYGYASPADFDGPFSTKPGLLHVAPGASETLTIAITVHAAV